MIPLARFPKNRAVLFCAPAIFTAFVFRLRRLVSPDHAPAVLFFNHLDPTGRSGLAGDVLTAAQFGCQAVTALTAITVQDTGVIEEIHPISEEILDNQARCLLEDIPVHAIRAGGLYSPDHVSVIAQIAADYDSVPLVLYLGPQYASVIEDSSDDEIEALLQATWETLIPQASCVVVDCSYLNLWAPEDDHDDENPIPMVLEAILAAGAKSCLALFCPSPDDVHQHVLLEGGDRSLAFGFFPLAGQSEAGDMISAALACELTRGQALPLACEHAISYAHKALADGRKLGMSKLIAQRLQKP